MKHRRFIRRTFLPSICALALLFAPTARGTLYYVSADSGNDLSPGTSWTLATQTIQAAIDLTAPGDTVLVTNGVYDTGAIVTPGHACSNRVVITNNISVQSVNGPDVTLIKGSEASGGGNGPDAVRGVYMSAGILSGFTITNGHTMTVGNVGYDEGGGGVDMPIGNGVVSNCLLTGNSAFYGGGGSYSGTLINCTLTGNSASHGGGSYYGTFTNCTISGNSALNTGGGSEGGTLNNCTLAENSSKNGGGSFSSTLTSCTLSGNSAYRGGGSHSGTLINCTSSGNSATSEGGGSAYSTLINCTLSGNSANKGGGSLGGALKNCIVFNNMAPTGTNWFNAVFSYSCTTPLPAGTGNIDSAPRSVTANDLHLTSESPCIDAGDNTIVEESTDLDGFVRIVNGTVDMGAYEYDANGDLHILDFKALPQPLVTFNSSTYRNYTMETSTNLTENVWTKVPGSWPIQGTGAETSAIHTNPTSAINFYRLKIEPRL